MLDALIYMYGLQIYDNINFCISNNELICKYKDLIKEYQNTSEVDFHNAIEDFTESEETSVLKEFATRGFNSLNRSDYLCSHRSDTSRCRTYCVNCFVKDHQSAYGNYDALTLMYGNNFYSNLEFCKNNNAVIMANDRGLLTLQGSPRKILIAFFEEYVSPKDFKIMKEYWQMTFSYYDFPIWGNLDTKIHRGEKNKLLKQDVDALGEEIRICPNNCEGVINDPSNGIIPRGLWLEERDNTSLGCAVVGINAGHAQGFEKEEWKKPTNTYEVMYKIWLEKIRPKNKYYTNSFKVINKLTIEGSLLWTDIIKCEFKEGVKHIPESTLNICTEKFLNRELDLMPTGWPIIALGREAFTDLCQIFPCRFVCGIYHPTPSRNSIYFNNMMKDLERSRFDRKDLENLLKSTEKHIWLPDHLEKLIAKKGLIS